MKAAFAHNMSCEGGCSTLLHARGPRPMEVPSPCGCFIWILPSLWAPRKGNRQPYGELCAGSHMIYSRSTMPLVPAVSYPDLATDRPWLPGSELGGVGEQPESLGTTAASDARFLAVAFSVQWCGWPLASAFMLAYLFVCFFLLS